MNNDEHIIKVTVNVYINPLEEVYTLSVLAQHEHVKNISKNRLILIRQYQTKLQRIW